MSVVLLLFMKLLRDVCYFQVSPLFVLSFLLSVPVSFRRGPCILVFIAALVNSSQKMGKAQISTGLWTDIEYVVCICAMGCYPGIKRMKSCRWVAQLVKHPIPDFGSGYISGSWGQALSWVYAGHGACLIFSFFPSLSTPSLSTCVHNVHAHSVLSHSLPLAQGVTLGSWDPVLHGFLHGANFSLCLCLFLSLSLCLSWINK